MGVKHKKYDKEMSAREILAEWPIVFLFGFICGKVMEWRENKRNGIRS